MLTSSGEAKIITMMPNEAAKNDAIMVMPSARAALALPGHRIAVEAGDGMRRMQGRLSRIAPMAPPYCEP